MDEIWELWVEGVGASGLSFGRSVVDSAVSRNRVLVHSAPARLHVTVRRASDGSVVAEGCGLERTEPGPMAALVRDSGQIRLEEGWPRIEDIGCLVLLPGGEAGELTAWWHADDHSSWTWSVQFRNHV